MSEKSLHPRTSAPSHHGIRAAASMARWLRRCTMTQGFSSATVPNRPRNVSLYPVRP